MCFNFPPCSCTKLDNEIYVFIYHNQVSFSFFLNEILDIYQTKDNRYAWGLDKEITSCILDMAKEHSEAVSKELPQVIMESTKTGELGPLTPEQYMVDNCRNVYLPGFEVTAVASMWGLMLLASHPGRQDRIRAEVAQACAGRPLEANMLGKMKVVCDSPT